MSRATFRISPTPDPSQPQGVYVPMDLGDCFTELKKILHPDLLKEIKESSEDDLSTYHIGLGMWLRNNWGLREGSRLAEWFQFRGVEEADDMLATIIRGFWRHLNGKPVDLGEILRGMRLVGEICDLGGISTF